MIVASSLLHVDQGCSRVQSTRRIATGPSATIIGGAADPSDVKAQKVCFSMLADLARSWFGKPGSAQQGSMSS